MNHMEDIAQMLGIELYEGFRFKSNEIDLSKYEYRFTEKILEYYYEEFNVWVATAFSKTICNLLNGEYEVVKLPKSILTEQEKEYLAEIIKPFRDKVKFIGKITDNYKNTGAYWEWIRIETEEDNSSMQFFEVDLTCRGMELDRKYTIEELGL